MPLATKEDAANGETPDRTVSRRKFIAGSSGAAIVSVAGCLGGGGGEDTTPTEDTGTVTPEKPDSITVRAWGGTWQDSVDKSIAKPYTDDTGISVEFDNTDRTVMQGKIRDAVEQDREPPVNVMWTTQTAAHKEYKLGLAERLNPELVPNMDEMFDLAIPNIDGNPPYLNLYSYTYSLCFNEEELERIQGNTDPVGSWADLQASRYKDEFGLYDNGYGFHPVLAKLADVELDAGEYGPMWNVLRKFEPSVGLIGDDTNLTQGIKEGEIAYATLLSNNIVDAKREQGMPVDWSIPEEGATAWTDSMYTPKNQDPSHLYWSQVFINYAADAENQTDWTGTLNLPMLNQNVEPVGWMEGDPAFPTSQEELDQLITVDPGVYARHSSTWYQEFNKIMGQ